MTGNVTLVGTPLGNMGDMSDRAKQAISDADVVLCEDSRRAGTLFQLLGIEPKRCLVINQHSEHGQLDSVVALLNEGKQLVLISDAGMPLISDPGAELVRAVASAGFDVGVVPGPTAVSCALALSGFSADRFMFEGFLPRKGAARQRRLASIARSSVTTVMYESPHRVAKTLQEIAVLCGDSRRAVVARELTKKFEEVTRGTVKELAAVFAKRVVKGEIAVVLEGRAFVEEEQWDDETLCEHLRKSIAAGVSRRDAVKDLVYISGRPKKYVYALALEL